MEILVLNIYRYIATEPMNSDIIDKKADNLTLIDALILNRIASIHYIPRILYLKNLNT